MGWVNYNNLRARILPKLHRAQFTKLEQENELKQSLKEKCSNYLFNSNISLGANDIHTVYRDWCNKHYARGLYFFGHFAHNLSVNLFKEIIYSYHELKTIPKLYGLLCPFVKSLFRSFCFFPLFSVIPCLWHCCCK